MKCKGCGSEDLRYSKRNAAEKLIGTLLPLRPYRCESCQKRVWQLAKKPFLAKDILGWLSFPVLLLIFTLLFAPVFKESGPQKASEVATAAPADSVPADPAATQGETGPADGAQAPPESQQSAASPGESKAQPAGEVEQIIDLRNQEEPRRIVNEADLREPENASSYSNQAQNKRKENLSKARQLPSTVVESAPPVPTAKKAESESANATAASKPEKSAATSAQPIQAEAKQPKVGNASKGYNRLTATPVATISAEQISLTLAPQSELGKAKIQKLTNRYVIDFSGRWQGGNLAPLAYSDGPLKEIRFGSHETHFRIVFEFREGVSLPKRAEVEGAQVYLRF